jgi:hypothetical protein
VKLAAAALALVLAMAASPSLACRVPINGPTPTVETLDAAYDRYAAMAPDIGLGVISERSADGARVQTDTVLRGSFPDVGVVVSDEVTVGCYMPPISNLPEGLIVGDRVLILHNGERSAFHYVILLDSDRARRLLALIASSNPTAQ